MAKSVLELADLVNFARGRFSKNALISLWSFVLAPFIFMLVRVTRGGEVAGRLEVVVVDAM